MLPPAHAAIGGIIGQIILPGFGFLVGTAVSIIPDLGMFFWKGYIKQLIKNGKLINRSKTEKRFSNATHSLFWGIMALAMTTFICHPIILITAISLIAHWLADAISHQRIVSGKPDYNQAFWPLPGHIIGLYDLCDNPKKMLLWEGLIPTILWLAIGLYSALN